MAAVHGGTSDVGFPVGERGEQDEGGKDDAEELGAREGGGYFPEACGLL